MALASTLCSGPLWRWTRYPCGCTWFGLFHLKTLSVLHTLQPPMIHISLSWQIHLKTNNCKHEAWQIYQLWGGAAAAVEAAAAAANGLPFPAIVPVSRRQMSLFQETKLSDNLSYWLFLIGWVVLAAEMASAFSSLRSRHKKYNKNHIHNMYQALHQTAKRTLTFVPLRWFHNSKSNHQTIHPNDRICLGHGSTQVWILLDVKVQ